MLHGLDVFFLHPSIGFVNHGHSMIVTQFVFVLINKVPIQIVEWTGFRPRFFRNLVSTVLAIVAHFVDITTARDIRLTR